MFIELEVKLGVIVHGYNVENEEVQQAFNEPEFIKKIVARHYPEKCVNRF